MIDRNLHSEASDITGRQLNSLTQLRGAHHITVNGSNEADTIEFYRDVLGMPLVLRQPNLDDPKITHLFFDPGDGRILTFFVHDERESDSTPVPEKIGSVHHLAFDVAPARYAEVQEALRQAGYEFTAFDRGIARSIYTRDHNGLTIELTSDKYNIPTDQLGQALVTAHQHRIEDDSRYIKEQHIELALSELGIEIKRHDFSTFSDPTAGGKE